MLGDMKLTGILIHATVKLSGKHVTFNKQAPHKRFISE